MKMIDWLTTKILPGWIIIAALFGTGVWYSSAAWKRLETLEENLAALTGQVESNRQILINNAEGIAYIRGQLAGADE